MKKEFSLRVLLGASFAIIVSVMIANTVVSYKQNEYIHTTTETAANKQPHVTVIQNTKYLATKGHLWFEELLQGDSTYAVEDVYAFWDAGLAYCDIMISGGEIGNLVLVPLQNQKEIEKIKQIQQSILAMRQSAEQRYAGSSTNGSAAGSSADEEFDAAFENVISAAEEAETVIVEDVMHTRSQADTSFANNKKLTIAVSAFVTLFAMILGFFTTRKADKLQKSIKDSHAYLDDSVTQIVDAVRRFSEGDVTVKLSVGNNDKISELSSAFNKAMDSVHRIIQNIAFSAQTTASAMHQLSATSEELSANTREQIEQIQNTVTSLEEVNSQVQQSSEQGQRVAQSAKQNNSGAQSGGEKVQDTIGTIQEIATLMNETAQSIETLGNSTKQISSVVDIIKDVAEQTNLLALNAAIEAARAGESGRGFAVVADEVRKLAERTQTATKQISDMIHHVQEGTFTAVASMRKGKEAMQEGLVLASSAGESLNSIVHNSGVVDQLVSSMASSMEEQSATIDGVSNNMKYISKSIESSFTAIDGVAHSIAELTQQAEILNDAVATFTLRTVDSELARKAIAIATSSDRPLIQGSSKTTYKRQTV